MKEFDVDEKLDDTQKAKLEVARQHSEAFEAWSEKAEPRVRAKLAQLSDDEVRKETRNMTSPEQQSRLSIEDHRSILVDMLLLQAWQGEQRRREAT